MAASLGDLIEVKLVQELALQQVLNIQYYRVTSITGLGGSYAEDIADWFDTNYAQVVASIQHQAVLFKKIEVTNRSNNVDFFIKDLVYDGDDTRGDSLPPFVSLGFIQRRESLATRNGYKRFAGVADGGVVTNTYTFPSGAQANVEAALAADIVMGVVTVAEPIILHRPPAFPTTSYTYASIGSAQYRGLGTQNTRKVGRGV